MGFIWEMKGVKTKGKQSGYLIIGEIFIAHL